MASQDRTNQEGLLLVLRTTKRIVGAAVAAAAVATALAAGATPASADPAFLPAPSATQEGNFTPYIVGGHAASQQYPWIVSLQINYDGEDWHICGGTLVARRYVLTAAHCVTDFDGSGLDPSLFQVRIGSNNRTTGGVLAGVVSVLPHPKWDWATGDDPVADIALLHLDDYIQKQHIEIAPRVMGPIGTKAANVRLLGWGVTEPDGTDPLPTKLQELDTKLVNPRHCADAFIGAGELCINNPYGTDGPCYGDSGGPALQKSDGRWKIVGITSRGGSSLCGTSKSVYTNTAYYRTWIFDTMRTGTVAPTSTAKVRPDLKLPGSATPLQVAERDGKRGWVLAR